MAAGKFRFGKIVWRTRQQDRSASVPADRIQLEAGNFLNYIGPGSAARIVVVSHDANALLAYWAMWRRRLVVGASYGVPDPLPGVRVWVESVGA